MVRIRQIPYEKADSTLKPILDELISKRGKLSAVLNIQSLHPVSIKSHTAFYMDIMFAKTALRRVEKELIAVVVSAANGCIYCQTHHGGALNAYWQDAARVERLKTNYQQAALSRQELGMCDFAIHLTKHPAAHEQDDYTPKLKELGLTDEAILDVVLVTGYFNFVNRLVLALGVELEDHSGEGYKY